MLIRRATARAVRWVARVVGMVASLFYVYVFVTSIAVSLSLRQPIALLAVTLALVCAATAGYAWSWWSERRGATVMAVAGLVLWAFIAGFGVAKGRNPAVGGLMVAGPYLLVAALFAVCSHLEAGSAQH